MGLLDKQSRIVDLVLTERGRRLYAAGELEFVYFSVFDDEIDYDPYTTGSYDEQARATSIEDGLVTEAIVLPEYDYANGKLEPRSHLFTAQSDFTIVPSMTSPVTGSSYQIELAQEESRGMISRFASSVVNIDLEVTDDDMSTTEPFVVSVYLSSSAGISELKPRSDMKLRRSYDPYLTVAVDVEPIQIESRSALVAKKL